MRVLGYGFREERAAERARQALTEAYHLRPEDARLGPLAGNGAVLAVRTREDNLEGVTRLLDQHGGKQLTDVDERWTGLRDDR